MSRGISLYFSLLVGNLWWRPVREGLRPQPASSVSMGRFRAVKNSPILPRLNGAWVGLRGRKSAYAGHL